MILFRNFSLQQMAFSAALLIYAVAGSPTPDSFGLVEIIIFTLLFFSLTPLFGYLTPAQFLFISYGLSVPFIAALVYFYPLNEIIRDAVPFLFLLMPVLYGYRGQEDTNFLIRSVVFIGLAFSIRNLISFGANIFTPGEWLGTPPDLLYLANSPEVLFTAIVLMAMMFRQESSLIVKGCCFLLAILPVVAMATLMQRASLFYIVAAGGMGFLTLVWKNPRMALGAAIFLTALYFMTFSFLEEIYRQLSFKTQMVGLNSRGAEWKAVWQEISGTASTFLFGLGWGSTFENPAVGGLRVSYTHSLLSSLFLKTGFVGVLLFILYVTNILKGAWPGLKSQGMYLYALAGPLMIGLCLYASYKSLGYGLLLLILASLVSQDKKSKKLDDLSMAVA